MTKSTTRTTKTSAVFLAAVLVAGTFALMSPSFMGGAAAYPDYGMEKKYKSKYPSHDYDSKYKSKDFDKKVIVKKVKCNNININVNGLTIGFLGIGGTTDALAAQAAEEDPVVGAANTFRNGFPNGESRNRFNFDDNFVFVCIDNNNNAGQGGGGDEDGDGNGEPETCEECFADTSAELRIA